MKERLLFHSKSNTYATLPRESTPAASRKRQQQHPGLTLTGIYNVLEKLRRIDYAPPPISPISNDRQRSCDCE
uniref:Uncharacterized protein n=1 Tax=Candidatus Kentrum sp. MB TaxID=2138164 RepID=A0A450XJV9_9GAMM|nr:MAG: hypothetical protein BECKMB1821G_GA0114241_104430 [Candidatus Kentron sp. MB]VFK29529.1 MAG: hypothetical protein BECKMB1821I_GA0114274_101044 [Candidatus Kentron sp. MB]VFK74817.1 MAG: hypothetical protein BECKMB1821H_GA0114242_101044 [Candidatus Kentron sp. MB]